MQDAAPLAHWRAVTVLAAVPLACGIALRLWHGGAPAFPSDDYYIAQHAARLLGATHDPSYPEASLFTGVTSPLHVVALGLLMAVVQPEWAGELLAWAGATAFLSGAALLIVRILPGWFERGTTMAVACLGASSSFHLSSGQETAWGMAAVTWGLNWMAADAPGRQRLPWLAAALPWLRPDLAFWSLGFMGWRWWAAPRKRVRDAAIVTASAAAYLVFWWWAAQAIVPNTVAAKRDFFGEALLPLEVRVVVGCLILGQFIVFAGPVGLLLLGTLRTCQGRLALAVAGAFWLVFTLGGAAGLSHNFYRYAQPFAGPLLLLGAGGWTGTARRLVLGISAVGLVALLPARWAEYRQSQAIVVDAQERVAAWLRANTPDGTRVLVHDAGYLSEYTSAELIDLVGLKTPSAARVHATMTGPSAGALRGDAIHAIACRAKPEYFVAFSGWEGYFDLTYDLMRRGWITTPRARAVVASRHGELAVTLYQVRPSPNCTTTTSSSPLATGSSIQAEWPQPVSNSGTSRQSGGP